MGSAEMKNKGMTFLISVCVCSIVFCSVMAGRLYETVSMLDKIAVEAEKHKQRYYDEGYTEGTKIYIDPNDEGILVGIGPTRDYSNYSDPCMLAQGASYNTDPNITWSLVVSDPNLIWSVKASDSITFYGSDGTQRSIGTKELKEMSVEEIRNMAACIMIMSYSGGMDDEWNDILMERLLKK